jgi:hypothetical protein
MVPRFLLYILVDISAELSQRSPVAHSTRAEREYDLSFRTSVQTVSSHFGWTIEDLARVSG